MKAIITISSPDRGEYKIRRKYTVFCEITDIMRRAYNDIRKSDPSGRIIQIESED